LVLAIVDLVFTRLTNQGLLDAGATIYTVVHCSGTVFTALFAVLLLKRQLKWNQWLGVVVVTVGLAVITASMHSEGRVIFDGILFVLSGTVIHCFGYIIIEYALVHSADPVAPEFLCAVLGMTCAALNVLWQFVYTIPRFESIVLDNVTAHHGNSRTIMAAYLALTIAGCVNSTCLFRLLHRAGSATTGIIKGLQSVLTFVTSHYAFCRTQPAQCFTPVKGASLVIVLCGVILYSIAYRHTPQQSDGPGPPVCSPQASASTLSATLSPPAPRHDAELELVPLLSRPKEQVAAAVATQEYGAALGQQDGMILLLAEEGRCGREVAAVHNKSTSL
jgi:drug/metabolite transporter (DMT)-like permease